MHAEQSPTVRKLRLGMELRRLRGRSGHTMVQAAEHVARTDSAVSRMETGQVAVSHLVLEKFLELYTATPQEREALRALAGAARQRGWWYPYADVLPTGFDVYLGFEAEATRQRCYEPTTVPDLLQTEDYARAVLEAEDLTRPAAARVELLLGRQDRLLQEGGPILEVVLHEAAIHTLVGSRETMRDQLTHLAALARTPAVTLQVLPFGAGAHPAMRGGGFAMLSVPLGGDACYEVAYLEHRIGGRYLDRPAEIETYSLVHQQLRDQALSPAESALLMGARLAALIP